jgi:hypothetical protein
MKKARVLRSVERWSALAAAMIYIKLGWYVFPTYSVDDAGQCTCGTPDCANAGKHPATPHGFKDATIDLAQVKRLFKPRPVPFNIAIVTGKRSGITVIDKDTGPGKVGAETWATLTKEHGEPQTLMAQSGSGGTHFIFTYTDALKSGNNRLGQHVDVKNNGGCIIVAPSRHKSGGVYAWMNWGTALAPVPAYLIPPPDETPPRGRPRKDDLLRRKYGLSEVREMLAVIPADDRDLWLKFGIVLGRTFQCSEEAWQVYNEWADKDDGPRDGNHEKHMRDFFYTKSQESADHALSIGTIVKIAKDHGWVPTTGRISIEALYYHVGHGYLYRPTMETWPEKDTNIAVSPMMDDGVMRKATEILQRRRLVTCVTSHPQLAEYTPDMNVVKGELVADPGAAILNVFRHSTIVLGDAALAMPWVEHCERIFNKPGDCDQFLDFMAHRVQRPWEKIRFALLIGGEQGTGKDTAIEMCVPAIGPWNTENIAPRVIQTPFNAYLVSVLLRINEAADAQDQSRWMLNEQLKNIIAGTPDHATINGKYQLTQHVKLYCAVIVTTNHLLSSIFIPQDDRRFDVIECATKSEMGLADDAKRRTYFEKLWGWFYNEDGARHVAAFLHARDLTKFSPNNGQRKTAAHRLVVQHGLSGDEWFLDALEADDNPDLFRSDVLILRATHNGEDAAGVRGKLPYVAERHGYRRFPSSTKDGRWLNGDGKKCALFVRQGVAPPTAAARQKVLDKPVSDVLKNMAARY